nr:hypothetical protein [Rhodococcus yunnanensis]
MRIIEEPVVWADHIASMAVTEFRQIWNVPHPSFLQGFDDSVEPSPTATADHDADHDPAADPAAAVVAGSEGDLADAVRRCLHSMWGTDLRSAPDGGFDVTVGSAAVYVYVADISEVRVHAPIVDRVSGRTRAAELIVDLNRRHPRLKFLLVDDRVHVTASVDASPFVPMHLTNAVARLAEFVARVDEGFVDHLGGVRARPHAAATPSTSSEVADTEDVPPDLMALLELDADGDVDVDDVVSVCGPDRPKIAGYESFCSEQARSWRECAREAEERGDTTSESECESEAVPWDRIVATLRLALRTVAFYDNA